LVMAIIGVMISLLLSAIQKARATADISLSMDNVRQMGLAVHNAASAYEGQLPPSVGFYPGSPRTLTSVPPAVFAAYKPATGSTNVSVPTFFFHLLPFIEQEILYNQMNKNKPCGAMFSMGGNKIQTFTARNDPTNFTVVSIDVSGSY